jgi:hypothetical protein
MSNENTKKDQPLISAEAIYQMGKIAKTHKAKGHIETEEERAERSRILNFCLLKIGQFPQRHALDLEHVIMWLEKSYKENPEKTFWHVMRANGIGGSDMGVLYAATEGDQGQSPFQTNRDIIKSKLFLAPIGEDSPHTSRGTRMEPYVKDIFLKDLAVGNVVESTLSSEEKSVQKNNAETNPLYGAKSILTEEMEASFVTFYDPEHPWLNGNPDEIIQKPDGKIVIVDYKAPVDVHGNIPDYYYAQVHHYGIIFKKQFPELADKVESVALANFNYREGAEIIYTEVPYDNEVADKVLAVGDKYWNDYVMKGLLPKSIEFGVSTEVEDLKIRAVSRDENGIATEVQDIDFSQDIESGLISEDMKKFVDNGTKLSIDNVTETLSDLIARYSTTRHIAREGEKVSDEFSFTIKHLLLNKLSLEDETDTIKTPTANIALIKRYDMTKLLPDLEDYWKKLNLDTQTLNTEIYNNPRAYLKNEFDPNDLYMATQNYMNDMAFYFNYKSGNIEKTPEDDVKFEDLENKFNSDLKLRKGSTNLNLVSIPEFMEAVDTTQTELDIDYLIKFTKRVDPTGGFPFRNYIDYNASDVTIRLRNPRDEKDLSVVDRFKEELRVMISDYAENTGLSYAMDRREATKQDVVDNQAKAELEAAEKERIKEEKRLEKEREKEEKRLAEEERKAEEKAKKELGDVSKLSDNDKAEISNAADDLLGKPAVRKKRVIKNG